MTTQKRIAHAVSILSAGIAVTLIGGCGVLGELTGGSSTPNSGPTAAGAPAGNTGQTPAAGNSPGAGSDKNHGQGSCEHTLVQIKDAFDEDIAKLRANPPRNASEVKRQQSEVRKLQSTGMGLVHQRVNCSNQPAVSAHITAESGRMNAAFARALLEAGDPLAARGALMGEYKRDDKVAKPEYRKLSRDIGQSYDEQRLALYRKNGKLGDNGKAQKNCLFSDKPFPKQPRVAPIFKTHLEATTVYVMCYLPRAASSYQTNIDPSMKLSMGINTGNTTFPLDAVQLGSPSSIGRTQYVFGEFRLPPKRKDFQGVKRLALVVSLQHHYKVRLRSGALDPRRVNVSQASFFWHQP